MADIANDVFSKAGLQKIIGPVQGDDFNPSSQPKLIHWAPLDGANKIDSIFSAFAVNRKGDFGQFYHFKEFDRGFDIIKNEEIQLTALYYHGNNDHAEFSEFLKRSQYLRMFCDNTIDDYKKKVFILCFTNNSREPRFWTDYARDETGVCLCFRINCLEWSPLLYELRDIAYDDGYRFDFINDLRYKFTRAFSKELFNDGIIKFAQFYKRKKYEWENETRLSFDYNRPSNLNKTFVIQKQKDTGGSLVREFIKLPFKNRLFEIRTDEIICGKRISDSQVIQLKTFLKDTDVKIWRRR